VSGVSRGRVERAARSICDACGRDAEVWYAPSPLWNLVMGGPEATDDPGGMLCPGCFIDRAESAGIKPTAWVLQPEDLAAAQRAEHDALDAVLYALQRQSHAEPWTAIERAYQLLTGGDPGRSPDIAQVQDA
jgi:hypothetical protein